MRRIQGSEQHLRDRKIGAGNDFSFEILEALAFNRVIGIARDADAKIGRCTVGDLKTFAFEKTSLVERANLLDELIGVDILYEPSRGSQSLSPSGGSPRRAEDVANAEEIMVHQLIFDFFGKQIATREMRDTGTLEAVRA